MTESGSVNTMKWKIRLRYECASSVSSLGEELLSWLRVAVLLAFYFCFSFNDNLSILNSVVCSTCKPA